MPKRSAGLLMYRIYGGALEVLLVHPGGPFWAKKDAGTWSIPKGEIKAGEEPFEAAEREFREETGFLAEGPFLALGEVKQSGVKSVTAWAFEDECDPADFVSTLCEIIWPPRSGQTLTVPEIDQCRWFELQSAKEKILAGQVPLLDELRKALPLSDSDSE